FQRREVKPSGMPVLLCLVVMMAEHLLMMSLGRVRLSLVFIVLGGRGLVVILRGNLVPTF
ncbi:hypothetical protein A2U01_0104714, partial [Trifolium medium]|nr:hypothetical protein [Trifolium medium]